jgi:arylsulfatase A-like enzyme
MPGPPSSGSWRFRNGFNNDLAYKVHRVDECLGAFFRLLRTKGLYDDSIIILTSDHGDATGEFGRNGHSTHLYPQVMRVPLMIHLPAYLRGRFVYDQYRVATLTDITPTLYYLLGHTPILANPIFGRPLLTSTQGELDAYSRRSVLLASDVRAAYGMLADNGRYLYVTYDSPAESLLYDLKEDPEGAHDILTPAEKQEYDRIIIRRLEEVRSFYGFRPRLGTFLSSSDLANSPW